MSIAALEPTYTQFSSGETSRSANAKDDLGMNQFLTMLVAQLKHQDPLNPMDGTDFTAQLAQFSGLEQQFKMNAYLADIQAALDAQENGSILDYIGKTIKTHDNTIFVNDGQTESSVYTLNDTANVNIYVYDEQGLEVRRMHAGWQDAGEHNLDWDGRDNSGDTVGDGIYTFEVEAVDEGGHMVSYDAYVFGEVTGVAYESGIPYLMVGDKVVSPSNIIEVQNTEAGGGQ